MKKRPKLKKRIRVRNDSYHKRRIAFYSLFVFFFVLSFFLFSFLYTPKITLSLHHKKIGSMITLNYREKYESPKIEAYYRNQDISDQVEVVGEVNTSKIGDYKVYYKVRDGLFFKTKILLVRVRDVSKPSLKLIGGKTSYACPEKEYQEEGYQAYDNVDGDITKKVRIKKVRDRLIYSVSDKAGNYQEIERKILYKDREKPVLHLKGDAYQTVYLGDNYEEAGVEVLDNCDPDLEVTTKGEVDTSKSGRYELHYSVMDKSGNKNSIKRVVNVFEHGQNGSIYLTFDDGPREGTTDVILDILKEEGVKATFFITSRGPDELVIREAAEGHTVALHTSSHDYSYVYSSVDNYYADLYEVRDRVKRLTGVDANIVRFPGGSSNTISRKYQEGIMSALTKDVLNRGFHYFDWNLASGDAGELHTAEAIYENVTHLLSRNRVNIILMHDIKPYTRDALQSIIRYGKENGYTFDKITEQTEMMHQRVNN